MGLPVILMGPYSNCYRIVVDIRRVVLYAVRSGRRFMKGRQSLLARYKYSTGAFIRLNVFRIVGSRNFHFLDSGGLYSVDSP